MLMIRKEKKIKKSTNLTALKASEINRIIVRIRTQYDQPEEGSRQQLSNWSARNVQQNINITQNKLPKDITETKIAKSFYSKSMLAETSTL